MPPPTVQVFGMWQGVVVTQIFASPATTGSVTRLLDGPRTSAELAAATGTHERSLHRLLRAMAGLGLLSTRPQGWALTPLGQRGGRVRPGLTPWAEAAVGELGRAVADGNGRR